MNSDTDQELFLLDYKLSFYYICVWNYSLICISYWQCLKLISFLNFECSD